LNLLCAGGGRPTSKKWEESAVDPIFERNYPFLLAWCRRHARRDLGDPEDFVHQAYLLCRRRWRRSRQSAGHEAAYFYRAVRWVVADASRRAQRRQRLGERVRPQPVQSVADVPVRELIAQEALARLTGKQRDVCLGLLGGQREPQLRSALRLTPATLAVHLCRARRKLRQHLGLLTEE
jgi:RNA polymerase sigma factor (sigma-70 family)